MAAELLLAGVKLSVVGLFLTAQSLREALSAHISDLSLAPPTPLPLPLSEQQSCSNRERERVRERERESEREQESKTESLLYLFTLLLATRLTPHS